MIDIVERLRFDAARCEATFSKGVASNIEEAAAEIERLRAALQEITSACKTDPANPFLADRMDRIAIAALGNQQSAETENKNG